MELGWRQGSNASRRGCGAHLTVACPCGEVLAQAPAPPAAPGRDVKCILAEVHGSLLAIAVVHIGCKRGACPAPPAAAAPVLPALPCLLLRPLCCRCCCALCALLPLPACRCPACTLKRHGWARMFFGPGFPSPMRLRPPVLPQGLGAAGTCGRGWVCSVIGVQRLGGWHACAPQPVVHGRQWCAKASNSMHDKGKLQRSSALQLSNTLSARIALRIRRAHNDPL